MRCMNATTRLRTPVCVGMRCATDKTTCTACMNTPTSSGRRSVTSLVGNPLLKRAMPSMDTVKVRTTACGTPPVPADSPGKSASTPSIRLHNSCTIAVATWSCCAGSTSSQPASIPTAVNKVSRSSVCTLKPLVFSRGPVSLAREAVLGSSLASVSASTRWTAAVTAWRMASMCCTSFFRVLLTRRMKRYEARLATGALLW
mmetsp:Transcript_13837/g.47746  ORF Transcript_13837/g.47746 Transcript_13837/m.47746 type:complete len:201 (-) Transcript_13837:661-1263(-)